MVRRYVMLDHGEDREASFLDIEDLQAVTVEAFIKLLEGVCTQIIDTIRSVHLETV